MPGPWQLQTVGETATPPYFVIRWGLSGNLEAWSVDLVDPESIIPDLFRDVLLAETPLFSSYFPQPFPYDRYWPQVTLPLDPIGTIGRKSVIYTSPMNQGANVAHILVWDWAAGTVHGPLVRPDAEILVGPARSGNFLYFAERSIADGLTRCFKTRLDLASPANPAAIGADLVGVALGTRYPFNFWVTDSQAVTLRLFGPGDTGTTSAWAWPLSGGSAPAKAYTGGSVSNTYMDYPGTPVPSAPSTAFHFRGLLSATILSVGTSVTETSLGWNANGLNGAHVVKHDEDVVHLADDGVGSTRDYYQADLLTGVPDLPSATIPYYNSATDPRRTVLFPEW